MPGRRKKGQYNLDRSRLDPEEYLTEVARASAFFANHVCIGHDFTEDEVEFMKKMQWYKKKYHRPFPTWREVLAVIRVLGYTKDGSGRGPRRAR